MLTRRPIGRTGLAVTDLCFGGSGLGDMPDTYGYSVSDERARATLQAIFDSEVNFLDTSRIYGFGRSEERIGAAIRERGGLPAGFVLATKLDRDVETGRFDGDRARQSLDESRRALGLDTIPLLSLHDPEHARDLAEVTREGGAIDTLFRLKEEGAAQAVCLAMGRVDVMLPLMRDWPWDAIITHNRFTLLNRSAVPMMEEAVARGIAVLNAAPFAGGVLAKGTAVMPRVTYQDADDATLAPARAVEALCSVHGIAAGAAALQFSTRDPRVTSTIVGVTKPERVAQTLDWTRAPIPDAAWQALGRLPAVDEDPEAHRDYKPG
jgi:D-threo-aldose 1-dehydrogenase